MSDRTTYIFSDGVIRMGTPAGEQVLASGVPEDDAATIVPQLNAAGFAEEALRTLAETVDPEDPLHDVLDTWDEWHENLRGRPGRIAEAHAQRKEQHG